MAPIHAAKGAQVMSATAAKNTYPNGWSLNYPYSGVTF